MSGPVACAECHTVPSDLAHATEPLDLTWGPLARTDGALPTWNGSALTCANYCHGATMAGGALTAPVWNRVDGGRPPVTSRPATGSAAGTHPGHSRIACHDGAATTALTGAVTRRGCQSGDFPHLRRPRSRTRDPGKSPWHRVCFLTMETAAGSQGWQAHAAPLIPAWRCPEGDFQAGGDAARAGDPRPGRRSCSASAKKAATRGRRPSPFPGAPRPGPPRAVPGRSRPARQHLTPGRRSTDDFHCQQILPIALLAE